MAVVFLNDKTIPDGTPVEDISIAASHLQLFCVSQGLGSCWIHLNERLSERDMHGSEWVQKVCDLPQTLAPHCMLIIGYPEKASERKIVDTEASARFV